MFLLYYFLGIKELLTITLGKMMDFIHSEASRLLLFIAITLAQIFLSIFLLTYGSVSLKPFAIFLFIVQLFAIHKIYFYLIHFSKYRRV